MKIRCYQKKKNYFICETLYTTFIITTKQKSRAETQNIKKEETKKNITENHQAKIVEGNIKENKQWRYGAIGKEKINLL